MKDLSKYKKFSKLFRYPDDNLKDLAVECERVLHNDYTDAAEQFKRFIHYTQSASLQEMEEVYTKTFHIQAICYLDIGYVIFGEDYKRGDFLSNMKREQQMAGNDCGTELADNLMNVLTLLPVLEDEEFKNELVVRILIPALEKMLEEFRQSRIELKKKLLRKKHKAVLLEGQEYGNVYQHPLRALLIMLKKDFEGVKYEEETKQPDGYYGDFINGCSPTGCSISHKPKTLKS